MVLAIRTGAPVPIDWQDDRVLATAWELLADEDAQNGRATGRAGGTQMSG